MEGVEDFFRWTKWANGPNRENDSFLGRTRSSIEFRWSVERAIAANNPFIGVRVKPSNLFKWKRFITWPEPNDLETWLIPKSLWFAWRSHARSYRIWLPLVLRTIVIFVLWSTQKKRTKHSDRLIIPLFLCHPVFSSFPSVVLYCSLCLWVEKLKNGTPTRSCSFHATRFDYFWSLKLWERNSVADCKPFVAELERSLQFYCTWKKLHFHLLSSVHWIVCTRIGIEKSIAWKSQI